MATYYVDPAATGAADGSSWTDAWTSLQTAVDAVTTDDTVYARGTQTLATAITFNATPKASFIGCDATGTANAGQFVLDAASTATNVLNFITAASASGLRFENITCKRATAKGIDGSGGYALASTWKQCIVELCGNHGVSEKFYNTGASWVNCIFRGNGDCGFGRAAKEMFTGCRFTDNASHGFVTVYHYNRFEYCVFDNNSSSGALVPGYHSSFINCVFDRNAKYGISAGYSHIVGCRFTNHSGAGNFGIYTVNYSDRVQLSYCYFSGNTTDVKADVADDGTSLYGQASDGYVDGASGDFNLASDADYRSEALTIDFDA